MPRSCRSCSSSATSGWPSTSELPTAASAAADALIHSLRRQPLLVVIRPADPAAAAPLLERLASVGLRHVEIAWHPDPGWAAGCRELIAAFPSLAIGAASVCDPAALEAARQAGCGYAVSPVLERGLLEAAAEAGLVLVPGVFSPSEVQRARSWGCRLVKLFPAVSLGSGYWRRLREPLGEPLPFCIAAGGLGVADVLPWLEAGADAVVLGSSLFAASEGPQEPLRALLADLECHVDRSLPF